MAQGDISIINSTSLKVQTMVKKAHLGIVTALALSHDSRLMAEPFWLYCLPLNKINDEAFDVCLQGIGFCFYGFKCKGHINRG